MPSIKIKALICLFLPCIIFCSGCSEAYFYQQYLAKGRKARIEAAKAGSVPATKEMVQGTWRLVSYDVETPEAAEGMKKQLQQQQQPDIRFMPDGRWSGGLGNSDKPAAGT